MGDWSWLGMPKCIKTFALLANSHLSASFASDDRTKGKEWSAYKSCNAFPVVFHHGCACEMYKSIRGWTYAMWNRSSTLIHYCFETVSVKEVHIKRFIPIHSISMVRDTASGTGHFQTETPFRSRFICTGQSPTFLRTLASDDRIQESLECTFHFFCCA